MPMIRYDIKNSEIAEALRSTRGNIMQAAERLDCGDGIIHRWLRGVRVEPAELAELTKGLTEANTCTCCGIRKRSGWFLCTECFTSVGNGEIYPETRICYA